MKDIKKLLNIVSDSQKYSCFDDSLSDIISTEMNQIFELDDDILENVAGGLSHKNIELDEEHNNEH